MREIRMSGSMSGGRKRSKVPREHLPPRLSSTLLLKSFLKSHLGRNPTRYPPIIAFSARKACCAVSPSIFPTVRRMYDCSMVVS